MTRPNGVLFCSPARWSGNGVPGAGASLSVFEETLCVVILRQLPTCGFLGIAKKVLGRLGLHHDWRWNVIVQYHFPILSVVLLVGVLEPPMVLVLPGHLLTLLPLLIIIRVGEQAAVITAYKRSIGAWIAIMLSHSAQLSWHDDVVLLSLLLEPLPALFTTLGPCHVEYTKASLLHAFGVSGTCSSPASVDTVLTRTRELCKQNLERVLLGHCSLV